MCIDHGYGVILTPDIPDKAREWRNSPNIYRWCRQLEPISSESHASWLQRIAGDPTIRMYGIAAQCNKKTIDLRNAGGELCDVGVCGLTSIDAIRQIAEFSLYIASPYHGYSYGSNALRTLVKHGFTALNLNRIWGEVFQGNPALDVFKGIGFVEEGILRQTYYKDGIFINSVIISLLRQEWCESQRASKATDQFSHCE